MSTPNNVDWRTIIRRIKANKFTPIISDRVYFPGDNQVIPAWATEVDYPFPSESSLNIAHLAQYLGVNSRDYLSAKENFLDFAKRYTLEKVKAERNLESNEFWETLNDELYDLTFSQLAERLAYPQFAHELENPLRILAELPISIYLTTSYYDFLENTLRAAGKSPVSEICYWHDHLKDDVPSIFETERDYQPSETRPLVYHLNGLDAYPSSLVISEDDYLDFLIKISDDIESVPSRVTQVFGDSTLLLLGFELDDWSFKTLFRGLVSTRRNSRRLFSLSIQMVPGVNAAAPPSAHEKIQDYLGRYFTKADFDVYWGTPQQFAQELWGQWQGTQ